MQKQTCHVLEAVLQSWASVGTLALLSGANVPPHIWRVEVDPHVHQDARFVSFVLLTEPTVSQTLQLDYAGFSCGRRRVGTATADGWRRTDGIH